MTKSYKLGDCIECDDGAICRNCWPAYIEQQDLLKAALKKKQDFAAKIFAKYNIAFSVANSSVHILDWEKVAQLLSEKDKD